MNIFYLDKCPDKAARLQYNKHVVKMALESAQMLCTAHHVDIHGENVPYKIAHQHHPCTKWVSESKQHYVWLYNHFIALGKEYTKRYNKVHLSIIKCANILKIIPGGIYDKGFTQPPQAMPDEYKDKCSVEAYWNYYIGEKHTVANLKTEKIYENIHRHGWSNS